MFFLVQILWLKFVEFTDTFIKWDKIVNAFLVLKEIPGCARLTTTMATMRSKPVAATTSITTTSTTITPLLPICLTARNALLSRGRPCQGKGILFQFAVRLKI